MLVQLATAGSRRIATTLALVNRRLERPIRIPIAAASDQSPETHSPMYDTVLLSSKLHRINSTRISHARRCGRAAWACNRGIGQGFPRRQQRMCETCGCVHTIMMHSRVPSGRPKMHVAARRAITTGPRLRRRSSCQPRKSEVDNETAQCPSNIRTNLALFRMAQLKGRHPKLPSIGHVCRTSI
jgi:hypothetical protein